MRVTFLCHQLLVTSGQSRFLFNLALGLSRIGCDVNICALEVDPFYLKRTADVRIPLNHASMTLNSRINQVRTILTSAGFSRKLASLANDVPKSDWYIVVADEALGVVNFLRHGPIAWLSCGDLALMFLYPSFYRTEGVSKTLLSYGFTKLVLRHAGWARRYDRLLALSAFAKQVMSHLYSLPFQGVVYPPVDTDLFRPTNSPSSADFALAMVRNVREHNLDILRSIAQMGRLKIVGGGQIPGAESLGVVSDGELVEQMSNARLLVFPPPAELFGYPVLESLSCATPVLAFANGGPAEMIDDGRNGWLASTKGEFLEVAGRVLREGYPSQVRSDARKKATMFSIPRMAEKLLSYLK